MVFKQNLDVGMPVPVCQSLSFRIDRRNQFPDTSRIKKMADLARELEQERLRQRMGTILSQIAMSRRRIAIDLKPPSFRVSVSCLRITQFSSR